MAILKLSGLFSAVSGRLGGSILSNTKNGVFLKQNAYSQQPTTQSNTIIRKNIGFAPQFWRTLDASQRLLWQNETVNYPYVNRVGAISYYTAFGLFLKLNQNLRFASQNLISVPPVFTPVSNAAWILVAFSIPALQVAAIFGVANTSVRVFVSPPHATTLVPKLSLFREIGVYPVNAGFNTFTIYNDYVRVFGSLPSGQYISLAVRTIVNGNGNSTQLEYRDTILLI